MFKKEVSEHIIQTPKGERIKLELVYLSELPVPAVEFRVGPMAWDGWVTVWFEGNEAIMARIVPKAK